jgi:hypothetical protein
MANEKQGTDILVQGRIVWGGVKVKGRTMRGTNVAAIDPKTGQPIMEYAFGLAIPKISAQSTDAEKANFMTWWNAVQTEAQKLYPSGPPPAFAWKYVDGDGVKPEGGPYPEHYRGCVVVACTTRIPLRLFAWNQGKLEQVPEEEIKTGYFVQAALNIQGHGPLNGGKAGLYVNPSYVARVAHGPEIVNMPDPATIFGTQAPPMPVGGSASPIGMAATPGYAQPGFGSTQGQGQGFAPAPMAPAPAQPHYGVVPQQFQPQGQQGFPGTPNVGAQPMMPSAPYQGAPALAPQQMGNGQPPMMAQNAPAAVNGFPPMGQAAPMPQTQTAQYPTQATGFPQGNAQTAAFPGNVGGSGFPQMPQYPIR